MTSADLYKISNGYHKIYFEYDLFSYRIIQKKISKNLCNYRFQDPQKFLHFAYDTLPVFELPCQKKFLRKPEKTSTCNGIVATRHVQVQKLSEFIIISSTKIDAKHVLLIHRNKS